MTKEEYQAIYDYLSELRREYTLARKSSERSRIESEASHYAKNLPFELYCELNDNAASGLFRHGFFESDMRYALRILKEKMNKLNENSYE